MIAKSFYFSRMPKKKRHKFEGTWLINFRISTRYFCLGCGRNKKVKLTLLAWTIVGPSISGLQIAGRAASQKSEKGDGGGKEPSVTRWKKREEKNQSDIPVAETPPIR